MRVSAPFMGELVNARAYVIVAATAALAVLLAGRPVRAQQLYVTLICHVGKAKIVHLEIIDYGQSVVIRDGIALTQDIYPAKGISRQEINRLIEDNLHAESYRCSAIYGNVDRKN
jgi:hypothetical protein